MNRLLFLIICCFSAVILAQNPNWTSVKETNINVGSSLSYDIFTNQDGNHIIVQESSNLKYYKMNLNGQAGSPITLESTSVVSPSITGDGTRLYVVYRRSSETFIRTRVSTNGGSSWSYLSQNPPNSNSNSIESVMSNGKLHLTYQIGSQIKYSRNNLDGYPWTSEFTVSNTETASAPRIAAWTNGIADEVFFVFKTSSTAGKWRKYNVAVNQWSNIFNGYSVSPQDLMTSGPAGLTVGSDEVRYYYYYWTFNTPFFNYIAFNKNGVVSYNMYPEAQYTTRVHNTVTFDGVGHTSHWVCWCWLEGSSNEFEQGMWRGKNSGTTFQPMDLVYWNVNQQPVYDLINLSSGGNEVHVIWKDNLGSNNGNNLRYKWDNQNPIAPQNLTMTSHNNHPKLVWQKNPEQDVDYYRIYRKIGTGSYTLHTTVSASLPPEYVDNEETVCNPPVGGHCMNETTAKYYITAVDLTSKVSVPSNEVEAIIIGEPPSKIGVGNSPEIAYNYELSQNYPNPFNPTTSINYQIKEKGFVSLKVFDLLGKEVANLVSETQDKGRYSVVFNAINLPSGVYIYSLRVNDFVQNNKMTLLK